MKKVLLLGILIGASVGAYFGLTRDDYFVAVDGTEFRATYLIADPDAVEATAHLIVQSGEMDQNGPEGLAHYLEHLAWIGAFQGSGQGADRHANAWTNAQATVYWESFDMSELSRALGRLKSVLDTPDVGAAFAMQERDIVQREYDFRVLENPYVPVWNEIADVLYAGSPYARRVIGTPESIASYTPEAAIALHAQSHRPENAVLVVFGDFTPQQVSRALGAGHLDGDTSRPPPWPPLDFAPLTDVAEVAAKITTPTLIYQKLVKRPQCGSHAECNAILVLLENALDSELPGGVAGPLRFDNFLARTFDLDIDAVGEDGVLLTFVAEADRGVTPQHVHTAFADVLENAHMPSDTVEKIRARELGQFDADLTPLKTTHSYLINLISARTTPYDVRVDRDSIAQAKQGDIYALHDVLRGPGRTVVRYLIPIQ